MTDPKTNERPGTRAQAPPRRDVGGPARGCSTSIRQSVRGRGRRPSCSSSEERDVAIIRCSSSAGGQRRQQRHGPPDAFVGHRLRRRGPHARRCAAGPGRPPASASAPATSRSSSTLLGRGSPDRAPNQRPPRSWPGHARAVSARARRAVAQAPPVPPPRNLRTTITPEDDRHDATIDGPPTRGRRARSPRTRRRPTRSSRNAEAPRPTPPAVADRHRRR